MRFSPNNQIDFPKRKSKVCNSDCLLLIILVSVLLIQSLILYLDVGKDFQLVSADIGKHGLWRGAKFAFGNRMANYLWFVNESLPSSVPVVLPPAENVPIALAHTPNVQFFLYPREIITCTVNYAECADQNMEKGYAILITDPSVFPGLDNVDDPGIAMLDEKLGVYWPGIVNYQGSSISGFSNIGEFISAFIFPCIFLLIVAIPGMLLAYNSIARSSLLFAFAIGFGLSLGYLSFAVFSLLVLQIQISQWTIGIIGAFWYIGVFVLFKILRIRRQTIKFKMNSFGWGGLIILMLFIMSLFLSVGKGYHAGDAIDIWGAKGYGISAVGIKNGLSLWGAQDEHYPPHVPLIISVFRTMFSESLPESKVVFPFYYLALLFVVFRYLSFRIRQIHAILATLIIGSAPLLFLHSTQAQANLITSFYFVSAALLISDATALNKQNRFLPVFWGSLFLILAAWSRPEVMYIGALYGLMSLVVLLFNKKNGLGKAAALSLLSSIFIFVIWLNLKETIYTYSSNPSGQFGNAIGAIFQSSFHWNESFYIIRSVIDSAFAQNSWGITFWLIVILFLFHILTKRRLPVINLVSLSGFMYLAAIMLGYYSTIYISYGGKDLSWWINTGLERQSMPGLILIWIGFLVELLGDKVVRRRGQWLPGKEPGI